MVKYTVLVTESARKFAKAVVDYYYEFVSVQIVGIIKTGLQKDITLLESQPFIGRSILFKGKEFRSIVSVNYKIIYSINETEFLVKVVAIFDTGKTHQNLILKI